MENFEINKQVQLVKEKETILSKLTLGNNEKVLIDGEAILTSNSSDLTDYIKIVDADLKYELKDIAGYVHTDNNYNDVEKAKVEAMTNGSKYIGLFPTLAERDIVTTLNIGNWCTVDVDSSHSNKKTKFYYDGTQWIYDGEYQEDSFGIDDNSIDSTQNGWSASKLRNELALKANKDGTDIDLTTFQGDIIPITNGIQNIGSPTNRFGTIYVNEAKLSTNTLYIGDTPVIGTNQDTIMVKADLDQSLTVKTTGVGTTKVISASGVELSTSGMNANINVQATGQGANANLSATNQVNLNSPNVNIQGSTNVTGGISVDNLTVRGNVVMNGESFISNATTVQIEDNIIELNKNEVGYGVTSGRAGIKINRGDADDYLLIFDETDDKAKIGTDSTLKAIATEDYVNALLNNKLSSSNIKAGSNITITTNGNDITLNATGGSGLSAYSEFVI